MTTVQMIEKALKEENESSKKLHCFLENARELNDSFHLIPLLYGSLGLGVVLEQDLHPDDIDILIPEYYLEGRWEDFQRELGKKGYQLIDEHEHTFEKAGIKYSYASIENLEPFANITLGDMELVKRGDTLFKTLSLEHYLKVYETSSQDGYRINKKEKKDTEKINLIKQKIGK